MKLYMFDETFIGDIVKAGIEAINKRIDAPNELIEACEKADIAVGTPMLPDALAAISLGSDGTVKF